MPPEAPLPFPSVKYTTVLTSTLIECSAPVLAWITVILILEPLL